MLLAKVFISQPIPRNHSKRMRHADDPKCLDAVMDGGRSTSQRETSPAVRSEHLQLLSFDLGASEKLD